MTLTPTLSRPFLPFVYRVLLSCLEESTQHNGDTANSAAAIQR
ncbi:hypothetical protein [Paraflavitalea pollutisoli]|nr:hypothetical protein [Paraflavitalea sp. H1-2-19X]